MPPKKNKKPSRNGYWQFVMECRDKHPNKQMNQELQDYAARKWAAMTKEQRQPYEQMAQLARDSYQPGRYTTDGLEIEEVEKKEKEEITKKQEMRNDINKILKSASFSMNLDEKIFLLIHVNHLTYYPAGDKYFICELAVAALSLKNGIEEVFHRIVKPGKLPLGFYGDSLAHSKETHQMLELVQDEPYENNTKEVFIDMTHFLKKWDGNQKTYIVYSDDKTFEMTTNVIENFCQEFKYPNEIRVYNLQYLFFALRNTVAGKNIWPTETFSFAEIEKDVYSYTPNIACQFHDVSDVSLYCSQSIVTRYGFTICDHCCADLNIQLVPGFHVPKNSRILTDSRVNSSAPSVCSNDDFRQVPRSRFDSFSSTGYDENFPALGSKSSASSVISFSSMRTPKGAAGNSSKAAARIEQSFRAMAMSENKRDFRNLKFPQHGYKNQDK